MEIIEQESEALGVLADTIYRQKEAAVKADLELLNKTTDFQNRAVTRLNELDKMRIEESALIAEELGILPEEVTLTVLQKHLKDELDSRQHKILASLKSMSSSVRRSAKLNASIIKRCFQLGEQRLQKILLLRADTGLYANSGRKSQSHSGKSMILNIQAV